MLGWHPIISIALGMCNELTRRNMLAEEEKKGLSWDKECVNFPEGGLSLYDIHPQY